VSEPLRIYVAGPYCPHNCTTHEAIRFAAHNVDKALWFGLELMKKGHIAFVPHVSHFYHTHWNCDREYPWYAIDLTYLTNWADALFFIHGSKGADLELKTAQMLGLPIFNNLDKVPIVPESKRLKMMM